MFWTAILDLGLETFSNVCWAGGSPADFEEVGASTGALAETAAVAAVVAAVAAGAAAVAAGAAAVAAGAAAAPLAAG